MRHIEPQVFDLLEFLIRNRDRLVSRDDLLAAVWHGRIVSESTLASRINAARAAIGDNGEDQRLIRTILRKGIRFIGNVRERQGSIATREEEPAQSLALPEKGSIAVLPFKNMSGDPEQEYFADGMVDEIITALSRMNWLFVIASNSSFTYKGRTVEVKQVSRELGVRYLLEGSVRKAAGRVRIIGQLVDATTGAHIWADRFEGKIEDVFDLQDRVAASVIGAIAPKLEQAEIQRSRRKPTESLAAYDYFLRGMWKFYQWTTDANDEALAQFYRAVELDPEFASAHAQAAGCFAWRKATGCVVDPEHEVREASRMARLAVELGKDDAFALCWAGYSLAFMAGEFDDGAAFVARAVALNPNLARAWHLSGWVTIWLSKPDLAIEHLARAMRLSPRDPKLFDMQTATAYAHLYKGQCEDALFWAERAVREQPKWAAAIRVLAAASALSGQVAKAQRAMDKLHLIDPGRRISSLVEVLASYRPKDFAILADGLRKAGMPE